MDVPLSFTVFRSGRLSTSMLAAGLLCLTSLSDVTGCPHQVLARAFGAYQEDGARGAENPFAIGRFGPVVSRGYVVFALPRFSGKLLSAALELEVYGVDNPSKTAILEIWRPPASAFELLLTGGRARPFSTPWDREPCMAAQ